MRSLPPLCPRVTPKILALVPEFSAVHSHLMLSTRLCSLLFYLDSRLILIPKLPYLRQIDKSQNQTDCISAKYAERRISRSCLSQKDARYNFFPRIENNCYNLDRFKFQSYYMWKKCCMLIRHKVCVIQKLINLPNYKKKKKKLYNWFADI